MDKRGNSALFVCPFMDCMHVSDADIQAALNSAYRGYIRDIAKKEETHVDFFEKISEQTDYPII